MGDLQNEKHNEGSPIDRVARLRFDFQRTLQASACLLRLSHKRMAYIRLLKLLYIAEREWLAESGESITGDQAFAMRNGPVLSVTLNLIKGNNPRAGEWDDFIHSDGYEVVLVADPGRDELSKGVVAKLTEVCERFRRIDDWSLVNKTHEFEEWKQNRVGKASPIPWRDILAAQNRNDMIAVVEEGEAAQNFIRRTFGRE